MNGYWQLLKYYPISTRSMLFFIYWHRHIIHRDLKPENILLTTTTPVPLTESEVEQAYSPDSILQLKLKVADFGIAREAADVCDWIHWDIDVRYDSSWNALLHCSRSVSEQNLYK